MKVAYVLASLQKHSGWRSHAVAFLRAMAAYVEPVIFAPQAQAEEARALFPGLPLCTLPATQTASLRGPRGLAGLAAAYAAVSRGRFPAVDLVHSLEAYPTGLVGMWLARRLGCPHVLTAHGTYGVVWHRYPLDRLAYRRVLRRAGLVCPVSTGTARIMQQYFGQELGGDRLRPVLNGNDFYRSVPPGEAFRPQPAVPTLLSVGDVKPRKGQHISLAAFARVQARLPQARYRIAGRCANTGYLGQLQEFIRTHEVRSVDFLGAVTDAELRDLYRQASVFVLTPQPDGLHFEGFGLVYLEAGAYSLPVVGTRTGGVPDAVEDGVTGLLADPQDMDGLAGALLRLLEDPHLARRMGQANRRRAETLTWERTAAEQYAAYEELLSCSPVSIGTGPR